jgi:hypothetical protein
MKTQLTPDEKLRAAHAHLILGVDQAIIAMLFGVNLGRVNEAVMEVRKSVNGPAPVKSTRFRPREGEAK